MPSKKKGDNAAEAVIADDFTSAQIQDALSKTLSHIAAADAAWPGMVQLPSDDRSGNVGKLVLQLGPPLMALFDALSPRPGDDDAKKASKAKLRAVFDSVLGGQDRGKDAGHFEVDLLVRRLERAQAEQKIVEALEAARVRFADDALNTGEMVVEPGLGALELARATAANNAEFRSLLAPVLDKLSDMTKKARQRQDETRKAAKATKAGSGKPDA